MKQEAELEKERSEKRAKKATREQKTQQLPAVSQDFSQIVVEPHFERDDVRELEQQESHDYSQIDDFSDDEAEDDDVANDEYIFTFEMTLKAIADYVTMMLENLPERLISDSQRALYHMEMSACHGDVLTTLQDILRAIGTNIDDVDIRMTAV